LFFFVDRDEINLNEKLFNNLFETEERCLGKPFQDFCLQINKNSETDQINNNTIDLIYNLVLRQMNFEKPFSFFLHNHRLLGLLMMGYLIELIDSEEKNDVFFSSVFKRKDLALLAAEEVIMIWVSVAQWELDMKVFNKHDIDPFINIYDGWSNGYFFIFIFFYFIFYFIFYCEFVSNYYYYMC
jgi:hypothetical protein